MRDLSQLIPSALITASLIIVSFLQGCAPGYPSQPTRENASPVYGAREGDLTSCLALMENYVKYIRKMTDKISLQVYMQQRGVENVQHEAEIVELSKARIQNDQNLLAFCRETLDQDWQESILADLVQSLTDAGRAADALQVANECYRRFPESPYCVAASAEAFHILGRNTEARAAAERVVRRGPYDTKMEATISLMRALLRLINAEEQRKGH